MIIIIIVSAFVADVVIIIIIIRLDRRQLFGLVIHLVGIVSTITVAAVVIIVHPRKS